jgi:hypothetical protein
MRLVLASLVGVVFVGTDLRAGAPVPPYPRSPVIAGIDWASADTIIRRAKDSDNWPVTWADDDALYTTFGDGTGFPPRVEKKLGCGFVRITGDPDDFIGVNIRSHAEEHGFGRNGLKGWGILSVGGTLPLVRPRGPQGRGRAARLVHGLRQDVDLRRLAFQ